MANERSEPIIAADELLFPALLLNEKKEVIWLNPAARAIFPDSSVQDFERLIPGYKNLSNLLDRSKSSSSIQSDDVEIDGKNYLLQAQRLSSGLLLTLHNISAFAQRLKESTEQIKRDSQEISDLKKSNSDLEVFAYAASHDLQEPLRMITGFLNLLQMEYDSRLDSQGQVYIQYAIDGANRMKKLMDELLHYSRIGSEKESKISVDASALVQDAMMLLQAAITESGVHIKIRQLPVICVVASQVQQVFQNLIGNAIKFRRREIVAEIEIGCNDRESEFEFYVKDNGIGISDKFKDKVFLLFKQLNNKEQYPGSGMGLSICKKIVENHKGRIWIQSVPNMETIIYFTIPK